VEETEGGSHPLLAATARRAREEVAVAVVVDLGPVDMQAATAVPELY